MTGADLIAIGQPTAFRNRKGQPESENARNCDRDLRSDISISWQSMIAAIADFGGAGQIPDEPDRKRISGLGGCQIMTLTAQSLTGDEILPAIDALADLRIRVFAEWPYIYDGDLDYERAYLRGFVDAAGSVLVVAKAGAAIVGAATGSPMLSQKAEFRATFEARGLATDTLFYFGESVLLPAFRGRGIGHRFFDLREAQARSCGAAACAFAAVNRPADHPRRPPDYQPLDEFWRKRGYAPVNGFVTSLEWKDHDDVQPTAKDMQFWMKRL